MKKVSYSSIEVTFLDEVNGKKYTLSKEQSFNSQPPYKICIKIENNGNVLLKTFGTYSYKNEYDNAFDSLVEKFEYARAVDEKNSLALFGR